MAGPPQNVTTSIDETSVSQARALAFVANSLVSGLRTGHHRSAHHGASMIFAEHRRYQPGDDPRWIDWRAVARTDQVVIRRFEQEAQLRAVMVLDRSPSMHWNGFSETAPAETNKRHHANTLLAAFGTLLQRQGDSVGFDSMAREAAQDTLPPSKRSQHLARVIEAMCGPVEPSPPPSIGFERLATAAPPRSLIVVASDMLSVDLDTLKQGLPALVASLRSLRSKARSVLLFHVMHPDELVLRISSAAHITGLEGERSMDVDLGAPTICTAYEKTVGEFCDGLASACAETGAHYILADTARPAIETLIAGVQSLRSSP